MIDINFKRMRLNFLFFQKRTLLIVSVLFLNSCWIKRSSKQRFLKPLINTTYSFRIDGYYYHIHPEKSIQAYFFYKNGAMLNTPNPYIKNNISEIDEIFRSKDYSNAFNYNPIFPPSIEWTNFSLIKDSISFERIYPMQNYPHLIYTGHVINDTTFVITKENGIAHLSINIGDKKASVRNDTFHFRYFYPKPDSVSFANNHYIMFK